MKRKIKFINITRLYTNRAFQDRRIADPDINIILINLHLKRYNVRALRAQYFIFYIFIKIL